MLNNGTWNLIIIWGSKPLATYFHDRNLNEISCFKSDLFCLNFMYYLFWRMIIIQAAFKPLWVWCIGICFVLLRRFYIHIVTASLLLLLLKRTRCNDKHFHHDSRDFRSRKIRKFNLRWEQEEMKCDLRWNYLQNERAISTYFFPPQIQWFKSS